MYRNMIFSDENMSRLSILVAEDDPLARAVMAAQLKEHAADLAPDEVAARRLLETKRYDLCFLDLDLGSGDPQAGLGLVQLAASKDTYAVVMSGHDAEALVERAYDLGCRDFYSKGSDTPGNVARVLATYLARRASQANPIADRFVTADPATRARVDEALKYAPSDLPIMLLGPTGTGKTSLAALIHERSGRPGSFVAINCAAYTEDLLETELFGYRKGAFTGATDSRKGRLLAADKGTLFLDEVGAMSLGMQTKLLKAIEERSFHPVGSDRPEKSDFRVLSATLEDPQDLIRAGKLRFDFFTRVHGLTVRLPPLAERKDDILPLVAFFTRGGKRLSFAPEARELILSHDWPGNVRELKTFVDLLAVGTEGRVSAESARRALDSATEKTAPPPFATDAQYRYARERGLGAAVDRFTDELVARCLQENGGKKTAVLADLDISTRLLYASLERRSKP